MGRHDDSDSEEMEWHPTKPFVMRASCIFRYGEEDAQVAVCTGTHPWHVVLVGGQGEGLMWAHYQRQLADACEAHGERVRASLWGPGRACLFPPLDRAADDAPSRPTSLSPFPAYLSTGWSLTQTLMRSSHSGWGIGSLEEDTQDLCLMAQYLGHALGARVSSSVALALHANQAAAPQLPAALPQHLTMHAPHTHARRPPPPADLPLRRRASCCWGTPRAARTLCGTLRHPRAPPRRACWAACCRRR